MSIWSKLIGIRNAENTNNVFGNKATSVSSDFFRYAIVDVETGLEDHEIHDIGAIRYDGKNGKTDPLKTDEGDPWKTVQTVPRKTEEIDHLKTLQIAPPS